MKTWILTFGLGLIATLQAQENQDASSIWYLKAVVADKGLPKTEESVSVTPVAIRTLEGGNLEVEFSVLVRGQCHNVSTILEKTDQPDKFTAYGGKHVVYIIPSSVEDHYILYSEAKWSRHQTRMAELMGRDPEVQQEALEDLAKVAEARGLDADSIVIPRQRGERVTPVGPCPHPRGVTEDALGEQAAAGSGLVLSGLVGGAGP
ncbi:von Ebner gland protein 1-like [Octodon degus]|uniref:von Ebner gland protein 1-like n=1 Tax=Octodon degus TaxID=10160 RepID=A0A6P6D7D2_OCTDE|nr:von Ebner gland protein 1-like [Octodon degus]